MSSFLEKFYIWITADATGVEKGTKEAKKQTKSFTDALEKQGGVGKHVAGELTNLANSLKNVIGSYLAAKAIISGVFSLAEERDSLDKLSEALNSNVEDVDAWTKVAKRSGADVEGFQNSLRSLAEDLTELSVKGNSRTLPFFQALGVKLTDTRGKVKDVVTLLPALADSFKKLSGQQAFGIGKKLGFDEGTVNVLRKGGKELELLIRRQKELGVTTREQVRQSKEFKTAWRGLTEAFGDTRDVLSSYLIPIFTGFFNAVRTAYDYLIGHTDFVKNILIGLGVAITAYLLPALTKAAIAATRVILPLIVIGAIIAVVAAVFEDLNAYMQGNDSLTGRLLKKYPAFGAALETVGEGSKRVWAGLQKFGEALGPLLPSVEEFTEAVKVLFLGLAWVIQNLFEGLAIIITAAIDSFKTTVEWVKGAYAWVTGKEEEIRETKENEAQIKALTKAKTEIELSKNSTFNPAAVQSFSKQDNLVQPNQSISIGDVTINTQATDSQGIVNDFAAYLNDEMRKTLNASSSGVAV